MLPESTVHCMAKMGACVINGNWLLRHPRHRGAVGNESRADDDHLERHVHSDPRVLSDTYYGVDMHMDQQKSSTHKAKSDDAR